MPYTPQLAEISPHPGLANNSAHGPCAILQIRTVHLPMRTGSCVSGPDRRYDDGVIGIQAIAVFCLAVLPDIASCRLA